MRRTSQVIHTEMEWQVMMVVSFLLWCLLFVVCWPVAVLALLLYPAVWIISLPFRLVGVCFESVFALLRALLMLPARILGAR